MTVLDIFFAVTVITFIGGIFMMSLGWADYTTISYLMNATSNLQQMPSVTTLSTNLRQFALFFPDLAAGLCAVMIIESWILSFFIKAHPLAAVSAIAMLVLYTIASFFISNQAITIAKNSIFNVIIAQAEPLLFIFVNMPIILVIASIVDIAIAFTSSRRP